MTILFPVAGAAVAVAGADKLIGNRDYQGMFDHLGWSRDQMQAAAAAEVVGGALMMPKATRRLGGAIVAAVSFVVLAAEMRRGDTKLAVPRALVMASGLAALFTPRKD